jgi:hypothetical protein
MPGAHCCGPGIGWVFAADPEVVVASKVLVRIEGVDGARCRLGCSGGARLPSSTIIPRFTLWRIGKGVTPRHPASAATARVSPCPRAHCDLESRTGAARQGGSRVASWPRASADIWIVTEAPAPFPLADAHPGLVLFAVGDIRVTDQERSYSLGIWWFCWDIS